MWAWHTSTFTFLLRPRQTEIKRPRGLASAIIIRLGISFISYFLLTWNKTYQCYVDVWAISSVPKVEDLDPAWRRINIFGNSKSRSSGWPLCDHYHFLGKLNLLSWRHSIHVMVCILVRYSACLEQNRNPLSLLRRILPATSFYIVGTIWRLLIDCS